MKPLGLIVIIIPVVLIVAGFVVLNYSKARRAVDVNTKVFIALLSICIGTVMGFALFIPAFLLFCVIFPYDLHDGHKGMVLGQAIFGGVTALILGVIAAIVAYIRILHWRVRKTS